MIQLFAMCALLKFQKMLRAHGSVQTILIKSTLKRAAHSIDSLHMIVAVSQIYSINQQ